jgi:hypothetical protein
MSRARCATRLPGTLVRCELPREHQGEHRARDPVTKQSSFWGWAGPWCDARNEGVRCKLPEGHPDAHQFSPAVARPFRREA